MAMNEKSIMSCRRPGRNHLIENFSAVHETGFHFLDVFPFQFEHTHMVSVFTQRLGDVTSQPQLVVSPTGGILTKVTVSLGDYAKGHCEPWILCQRSL